MGRRRRSGGGEEDTGTWMNTYSDLVTLLLTFFILLFSMSKVDADKFEQFVKALTNPGEDTAQIVLNVEDPPEGTGLTPLDQIGSDEESVDTEKTLPQDFDELYRYLKAYAEQNDMENSVEITRKDDMVFIRFQNDIFFAPDKSDLRPASFKTLDFLGDCLNSVQDEIWMININGHTASVENPENYRVSDWLLSSERAGRIAVYFDDQKHIDPKKLRPMGYGKNYPISPNDTEENREKNRRVDMMIISEKSAAAQNGVMLEGLESLFDPSKFPQDGDAKSILAPPEDQTISPEDEQALAQEDTIPVPEPALAQEDTIPVPEPAPVPEEPQPEPQTPPTEQGTPTAPIEQEIDG